jgi:hypothetical protein
MGALKFQSEFQFQSRSGLKVSMRFVSEVSMTSVKFGRSRSEPDGNLSDRIQSFIRRINSCFWQKRSDGADAEKGGAICVSGGQITITDTGLVKNSAKIKCGGSCSGTATPILKVLQHQFPA